MKYAIGLMSGSSMDGIDAALIRTDGLDLAEGLHYHSLDYSPEFKMLLRAAEYAVQRSTGRVDETLDHSIKQCLQQNNSEVEAASFANIVRELTLLHAKAVHELLKVANLQASQIDIIGFHGQNLLHEPQNGITLQVGDGKLLASACGIPVVYDFRSNDVKQGGQGAPFAPIYHLLLAKKLKTLPVAFVNCGGIANISFVGGADITQVLAFDCGPGNVLIDRLVRERTNSNELMDQDGKYGMKGAVDGNILEALKQQAIPGFQRSFCDIPPPKSLDTSNFRLPEIIGGLNVYDACATLEAFTAFCIVESIKFLPISPALWVLAGGGWNNPVIVAQLKEQLRKSTPDASVKHAEGVGLNGKYMEAELFAYLAVRTLKGLPISYPNTTGVHQPCIGGDIVIPAIE